MNSSRSHIVCVASLFAAMVLIVLNETVAAAKIQLSREHTDAVNRQRRMIVYFDANFPIVISYRKSPGPDEFVRELFAFTDDEGSQVDSVFWFLPQFDFPHDAASWIDKVDPKVDIVKRIYRQTRKRELECFYSHRMNGGSHSTEMKCKHPDWCFRTPWLESDDPSGPGYWNFAYEGARKYTVENLLKVAREFDLDGLELDFARGVVLPAGQQWKNREAITQLVRDVRIGLLEIERERARPFLLATRVPENIMGCHFDGLDVETWASQQLVDLFVLGCRDFEVDLTTFHGVTAGTSIKLYPSLDDHHACEGYQNPGNEVWRPIGGSRAQTVSTR